MTASAIEIHITLAIIKIKKLKKKLEKSNLYGANIALIFRVFKSVLNRKTRNKGENTPHLFHDSIQNKSQ